MHVDLGRHPSQKTEPIVLWVIVHGCRKSNKKGMIPIAKNIIVVDEQGNEYEATYPKRAKGLVKNGRARFVSENKICLACPPNTILEDTIMSKNSTVDDIGMNQEINRVQEHPQADVGEIIRQKDAKDAAAEIMSEAEGNSPAPILSMDYVLTRIDKIINDTAYLHEAITALANMEAAEPGVNGVDTSRGEAIKAIVVSRETTNQQTLKLLEKMYDEVLYYSKPKELSDDILKLQQLTDILCRYPNEFSEDVIRKASQQMFVRAGAEIVK